MQFIGEVKMRNYSIDTLKFFGAFFVVCIHTKPFRDMDGQMYDLLWGVIRIIASFAVPFFFTAMGYLFFRRIDKEQSIRYVTSYLRKCCKYLILTVGVYSIYHCLKLSFHLTRILYIQNSLQVFLIGQTYIMV